MSCSMPGMMPGGNVPSTEAWVQSKLHEAGHDSSHDWRHIHRVRNTALRLAKEERLEASDVEVVELAALLHDVGDHKYSSDPEGDMQLIQEFLERLQLTAGQRHTIMFIIRNMGFKEELERGAGGADGGAIPATFAVVQDADRLDAIGAIGIARCLTFGGAKGRVLHDPAVLPREQLSKEQYTDKTAQQTTINHFYEKLLKLKGMMKTEAGRRVAQQRHDYMQGFLHQLLQEWEGQA